MSVQGLNQLQARFTAIQDTAAILKKLQIRGIEYAKRKVPRKTAYLARTIREGSVNSERALLLAQAPYAAYVERGTGIYGPGKRPIKPKRKKFLAWPTGSYARLSGRPSVAGQRRTRTGTGSWAFARQVKGRPATPYLMPGAQQSLDDYGVAAVIEPWNGAA